MFQLSINRFEADPEKVSEILDLQPTFVARKDEVSPQSGRPYKTNAWALDVHLKRLFDGAEHDSGVASVVDLLRGREGQFALLREEVRPEIVTLYGGLYVRPDAQCGIWLDPPQMHVLARCEVGWGLDIFIDD